MSGSGFFPHFLALHREYERNTKDQPVPKDNDSQMKQDRINEADPRYTELLAKAIQEQQKFISSMRQAGINGVKEYAEKTDQCGDIIVCASCCYKDLMTLHVFNNLPLRMLTLFQFDLNNPTDRDLNAKLERLKLKQDPVSRISLDKVFFYYEDKDQNKYHLISNFIDHVNQTANICADCYPFLQYPRKDKENKFWARPPWSIANFNPGNLQNVGIDTDCFRS